MDLKTNFELLDNLGLLDLRNHERHPCHKRCQTVATTRYHTCDPGHCLLPRQIGHMLQETQGTKMTSDGGIRLPTSIRKSWSKASRVLDFVLHPGRPWKSASQKTTPRHQHHMVNHLRREFNPFQRRISTSTRRGKAYHESVVEGSKDVSHAEYMLSFPHGRPESHILLLLYSHFLLPRLHAQNGNQQNHQTHQHQQLSALVFLPTNSRFSSFVDFQAKTPRKIHHV